MAINKPVEGSREPGFSHIYRNSSFFGELVVSTAPGQHSLKSVFIDMFLNKYPNKNYLGNLIFIQLKSK